MEGGQGSLCPQCSAAGFKVAPGGRADTCAMCGASIRVGETSIRVEGARAEEVEAVARALVEQQAAHRDAENQRRAATKLASPWSSGLFYLVAAVVLVGLVLGVAAVVPLWAVPLIIIGGVTLLAVVGAFQLRQDEKLGEKNFIELMKLALSQLKLFARSAPPPPP